MNPDDVITVTATAIDAPDTEETQEPQLVVADLVDPKKQQHPTKSNGGNKAADKSQCFREKVFTSTPSLPELPCMEMEPTPQPSPALSSLLQKRRETPPADEDEESHDWTPPIHRSASAQWADQMQSPNPNPFTLLSMHGRADSNSESESSARRAPYSTRKERRGRSPSFKARQQEQHQRQSPLIFLRRAAFAVVAAVKVRVVEPLVRDGGALDAILRRWRQHAFQRRTMSRIHLLRQAQIESEQGRTDKANLSRASSLRSLGEMGVALFSPLDGAFETDLGDVWEKDEGAFYIEKDFSEEETEEEEYEEDEEEDKVEVEPEPEETLKSSPRILTLNMKQQIVDRGLPSTVQLKKWVRLYSVARDGDAFGTFLRKVRGHSDTIIVARTTEGEIVGGFADAQWERLKNGHDGSAFYGTGHSFLFSARTKNEWSLAGPWPPPSPGRDGSRSTSPAADTSDSPGSPTTVLKPPLTAHPEGEDEPLTIYKWKGKNHYNQLCHTGEGRIAMGGGGYAMCFGLCIQDYFSYGSTGPCDTYGTVGPLTSSEHFEIVDFEVYGFEYGW